MQIAELAARLKSVGLSDKESKVYVATLFLGSASVQKIAEQAHVNRPTAYAVLDQLAAFGLVSQTTEATKTVYVSEGPDAIERWIDIQEQKLKDRRVELESIKSELRAVSREADTGAPTVRFMTGNDYALMDGYIRRKAVPGDTIYSFMNLAGDSREGPESSESRIARTKKRLHSKLMYSSKTQIVADSQQLLQQTKKVDDLVAADITLYDGGVGISVHDTKEPIGIIIESPVVAKALRQLFELAWDSSL